MCQLIRRSLQSVGSLIQLPSTETRLISKALISHLIPADTVKDDMAVLMLIEDDEVDCLVSMLASVPLAIDIPIISVMMDLCRSPHNMWALASRDVALVQKLSNVMDGTSKDDQSKATQLIWRMIESNFNGSEEVSAIINSGSLQGLCIKRVGSGNGYIGQLRTRHGYSLDNLVT